MLGMQGKSPAEIGRLLHVNTTTVSRFLGRTTVRYVNSPTPKPRYSSSLPHVGSTPIG